MKCRPGGDDCILGGGVVPRYIIILLLIKDLFKWMIHEPNPEFLYGTRFLLPSSSVVISSDTSGSHTFRVQPKEIRPDSRII